MLVALPFLLSIGATPANDGWQETARKDGVVVFARAHEGTDRFETLAVSAIDAPPWVVKNAIDDIDRQDDMPYLKEARVIRRDPRGAVIYHRMSPPFITDRDYTIRLRDESAVRADGTIVYVQSWRTANELGPPPRPKVVRVPSVEGYWRLEPIDGGKRTRASYFVYSDPGGAIPQNIANWGSESAMPSIFKALRKRVADKKYAVTKPALPDARL